MPVGLTVGDASTCYQTYRKERHEVGLNKGMTVNGCKNTKSTFGKFASNCLGDPYQDPGQYILRKPRSSSQVSKPFVTSGNKKVRKSEFEYIPQGPPKRGVPESAPRFATRVKAEPFTNLNTLGYSLEPYERKQDFEREDYGKRNGQILHRDQPWSNTVRQRGSFQPNFTTFGTNIAFPEKQKDLKKQPLFGPFKQGDPLHTGYNKCIGRRNGTTEDAYVEEMEEDPVKYQRGPAKDIWRGVTNGQTMMNSTTMNNARNINRERRNVF
jgi:hypothetical protein